MRRIELRQSIDENIVQTSPTRYDGTRIMKLIDLTCNHCGAPLEVPAKTRFLSCTYCQSRLAVRTSGGAAYTEVLDDIASNTDRMADDLEAIRTEKEIERLDREWQMTRQGLLTHDKDGNAHLPNRAASVGGGVIAIIFGALWMVFASSMGAPGIFPLFGLVFIGFAVVSMFSGVSKSSRYSDAKRRYEDQRRDAIRKLSEDGS